MIPLISGGFLTILDRFLRAPLQAGKTLLTSIIPDRFSFTHGDISGRAYLTADFASIAFIIDPELFIHFWHMRKTHTIKSGK